MDVMARPALSNKSSAQAARLDQKWTVADVVVDYLHAAGVTKIFGVPGGATIPFHNSIEKHREIDFVLARHEGGAAFMADCYARISGKLGVCVATTGPGATNLMTGVGAAYMDSIPMLVLSGMNPTDTWGRGDFQECTPMAGVDTTAMFKSMCKLSEVIVSERILKQRLINAIATALSGRPGPVHLAIPRDLWAKRIAWEPYELEKHISSRPAPSESIAAEVANLLRFSKQPLILCGSGTSTTALSLLLEISQHFSIPLVTTPRGKGKGVQSVPNTFLGSMGISASPVVDDLIKSCTFDVVLAVGAGFGSYATNSWDPGFLPTETMIQVNIDTDAIGRIFPADIGIVADSTEFAMMLRHNMLRMPQGEQTEKRVSWVARWALQDKWPCEHRGASGARMSPVEIIRAVDQSVGKDGIVLADSNSILLWATRYLPERSGRRFFGGWGWASMGHMTAGAIGAKLASPESDVVALVGDGCFLMNGSEMATAVELGLNIVWIINVNAQLGMIHYEMRGSGLVKSASFGVYDYVGFARSLGAQAELCDDPEMLTVLINDGLARSGPTVIQVNVDPEAMPPMGMKKEGSARWKAHIEQL